MYRRGFLAILPALLALVSCAGPSVHAGSPQLTELNAASLEGLKAQFNRAADRARVILLLSPT